MPGKLIGSIMIIAACGSFGFTLALRHRKDISFLHGLVSALDYMECEITYHLTPLPDLLKQAGKGHPRILGPILISLGISLQKQISPDVSKCMESIIDKNTNLSGTEKEVLRALGRSLGKYELEGQLAGIESVRALCRNKLSELEADKEIKLRNYQTLSICTGAAIAILLL